MKKLMALALAFLMVFAVMGQSISLAAEPAAPTKTKSVTLHKLVMPNDELKAHETPEGYDGTQDLAAFNALVSKSYTEAEGVYFAWVKAGEDFNESAATVDKEKEFEFVKTDGTAQRMSLKDFIAMDPRTDYLAGTTGATGLKFNTTNVPDGDYAILELRDLTTYKGTGDKTLAQSKAVPVRISLPLVNDNGVVENAHVYPKNTEEKPKVDKDFDKGNVRGTLNGEVDANKDRQEETRNIVGDVTLGETVKFAVDTIVPAGSNFQFFRWSDVMTKGLTFNKEIKFEGIDLQAGDYTLIQDDYGFTLELNEQGLAKINNKDAELKFQIKYSATVNGAHYTRVDKNNIMLEYDHKPKSENEEKPTPTNPSEKQITVTKTWAKGGKPAKETTVVYSLYKSDHTFVKSVSITGTEAADFNYTFTGLDDNEQYYVRERVVGYAPQYGAVSPGNIAITNDEPNHPHEDPEEPSIESGGKKFVKADASNPEKRLAGAEFVIKQGAQYLKLKDDATKTAENAAYTQAQAAYEKAIADYNTEAAKEEPQNLETLRADIATKKTARDEAFLAANKTYEWVEDKEQAYKLTSDDQGRFEIHGLAFGNYELEEITAPAGYAKATNNISFAISKNSLTTEDVNIKYNPEDGTDTAKRIDNKKTNIPQTGGIGTIVFTVAGLAVMGTALMSLRKRRQEA